MGHAHARQPFGFGKVEKALHFTVEAMAHLFKHDVSIGILARMLAYGGDTGKNLVHIRHIEVAAKGEVLRAPVVPSQEGMHIRDAAFAGGGIAQVSHVNLTGKGKHTLSVFRIVQLFFCQVFEVALHRIEYFGNGARTECTLAEHVFFTGIGFQLYASQPGTFLSAVMLFLHQQIEFVQTVHPCAVLLFVVLQRFQQAYHGDATFMLQFFHLIRYCL